MAPKVFWDKAETEILCDLLVNEVVGGNRVNACLNQEAWNRVREKFRESTGKTYDRTKFKNKWDSMKRKWKAYRKIMKNETGIGYDQETGKIEAPAFWWQKKIQEDPDAKELQNTQLFCIDQLDIIFESLEDRSDEAFVPGAPSQVNVDDDNEEDSSDPDQENIQRRRKSNRQGEPRTEVCPSHANKGKKKKKDDPFDKLTNAVINYTSMKISSKKNDGQETEDSSISRCMAVLENTREIAPHSELFWFAIDLFRKDKDFRSVWVSMGDSEIRFDYIQRCKLEYDFNK